MQTRAAVLWEVGKEWSVETIELDPPGRGEVMVRLLATGLCHSDEHLVTGDLPFPLPIIGGHEGTGVVEQVGPGVEELAEGDRVVFGFIPSCGRCPSCSTGHQNLCDLGRHLAGGRQISDGTARHHAGGADLGLMCLLGTFAERTVVHESSCIKVDPGFDPRTSCLLGCGVVTGWGSSVYAAEVRPGDDVVVVGVGGIGINAVQGARIAGAGRIFAIDPVPFKRERALSFGATHAAESLAEARELVGQVTLGRMADKVILTMGVGSGEAIGDALSITAKRGRVVVTNLQSVFLEDVKLNLTDLTLMEKQVVGSLFGSANPRKDIPALLELNRRGLLELEGLVTRTYALEDINLGYEDMRQGRNLRGVIVFE
jgi:S-(hydroxymethyl)glutathione dehydrogenase/alcohol dehydrogenase